MTAIYGAKAKIRIRFEGNLKELSLRLSKGLGLPDFEVESREDPPYDVMGSNEALGFEMWLEEQPDSQDSFHYSLTLSSQATFLETAQGRMYDLSAWFAKITSVLCGLDCLVAGTSILFINGKEAY